jgi:hypothetical protein
LHFDKLNYYKTSEWKNLRGEFKQFANRIDGRKIADKVRTDLEDIILSAHLIGFTLGVIMQDYKKVLRTVPEAKLFYEDDPTVTAYYHLMDAINRTVRKKTNGFSVAFIYDQSSQSDKISHAFNALKSTHPITSKSLATFAPLDDKLHPPLQAADLLADIGKGIFGCWLAKDRPRHVALDKKWVPCIDFTGRIDEPYMLYEMRRNLSSNRFAKGSLPTRPIGRRQQRRNKTKP